MLFAKAGEYFTLVYQLRFGEARSSDLGYSNPHRRVRSYSMFSNLRSRTCGFLPVGRCPVWAPMCVVLCGWLCVWAVCASRECSSACRGFHFESIGELDPSPLSVELGSLGLGSHALAFLLPPKRFGGRGKSAGLASTDDSVGESVKVIERQRHVFARERELLRSCGHRDGPPQPV